MTDDEPTRLLPLAAPTARAEVDDRPTARQPVARPAAETSLPSEDPDPQARVIVLASIAAVVGLAAMLTVIISTRDGDQIPAATSQMVIPNPTLPTAQSRAAADPASASPLPASSPTQRARHLPAATASRSPSPAASPTPTPALTLSVGTTVGLEVAGKPGLRLHFRQAVVRVDPLSSGSSPADLAGSRFVVHKGLGADGCVSLEAAGNPGFYLRRFFADLVLHKRDGSPVFDQEATFCPQPTADGSAVVLVVRFPEGFVVVASPDGLLHLAPPDLTSRTAFVVRKPL